MKDNVTDLRSRITQLERELVLLRSSIAYIVSQLSSTVSEIERSQRWYEESSDIDSLKAMRDFMVGKFSRNDIRDICFNMNINPESLDGETISSMCRELILLARRQGRLTELQSELSARRPQ